MRVTCGMNHQHNLCLDNTYKFRQFFFHHWIEKWISRGHLLLEHLHFEVGNRLGRAVTLPP